mmetsp:Transcript_19543/g.46669  ORF Transcript_19543/g.46669 Transcript_19543/m.46669 type:complete len:204 (+) Transcript_19543:1203-1814(+)
MPQPMCAACIIPTSLAPSPTASVIARSFAFTSSVTLAFCRGDTRQQTTEWHSRQSARNASSASGVSTLSIAAPSTTRPAPRPLPVPFSADPPSWSTCCSRCPSRSATPKLFSGSSSPLRTTRGMSEVKREHETAMLMAVSSLSPVSTHTLSPAESIASTVVPTPSCSLSSTAVAPSSVRPASAASAASAMAASRPVVLEEASS